MGHNLEQLGTATLDTMGGLVTNCNPQDLPEGASPRTWDTDFITGSVFTRAGLSSVYSYATALNITNVVVGSADVGVFTYTASTITPTINEGFVLQNFSGGATFLNGQTVFVLAVDPIGLTFTATVTGALGAYPNQSGSAVSIVGQFLGPKVPTVDSQTGTGNSWANPDNILGNTAYASSTAGASTSSAQVPTHAQNQVAGGAVSWLNPANLIGTISTATLTFTAGQTTNPIAAYQGGLNIPANATVLGVSVFFKASCNGGSAGSLKVQLINGNTLAAYGATQTVVLSSSTSGYTVGSSTYQWGSTLTSTLVNGAELGVQLTGSLSSGTHGIAVNSLVITVYYSLAGSSNALKTTGFGFSAPSTSGITGFGVTFQAYTSSASSVTLQLLKNGVAVGSPKTQALTTTPTIYTLGAPSDLWNDVWQYSDVNNANFGVQVSAGAGGTTFINDLDMLVYITPAQVNFNYVKSYIQNNGQIYNLALDASGLLWQEDTVANPGALSVVLSGILPGSFAKSVTMNNNEYIMFSDLSIGTERPRVYFRGQQFLPLSQGGPGAPPSFVASEQATGGTLAITSFTVSGGVATFTFTASGGFTPVVNSLYTIQNVNTLFNGLTFSVLGTPAPTTTTFSVASSGSTSGSVSGTASPSFSYNIKSIVQNGSTPLHPQVGAVSFNGQELLWSAGPGQTTPGSVWTFYYGGANVPENASLLAAINSGNSVYVYVQGCAFGNGTLLVTGHGAAKPPNETDNVPFFTATAPYSQYTRVGGPAILGNVGTFQQTLATLTTSTPIPSLSSGDALVVSGETPSNWNGNWTVVDPLNSGVFNITATSMSSAGVASYTFSVASGVAPTVGEIVTVSNCTNNAVFNTTGVVASVTSSVFTISGFSSAAIAQAQEGSATGISYGTQFTFDPGGTYVGTTTNSIFGNAGAAGAVTITGGATTPVGSGTRQGVVYFITTSGFETAPSAPVTFTTSADANYITASQIPIGPPNTVARGIAFTEAGQNGVPGANFYVIEEPFVTTVNGQTKTYSSTIVRNNTDTTAKFTFTDAVLLNSREIDVQGDNLFNLIELGSSAWAVPYAGRMFYGLQLNKVDNWTSGGALAFDGGYMPNPGGNTQPLGWNFASALDQTLISSPVTGQALYIKNVSGTVADTGVIYQTAYQDPYGVAIIQPNIAYSARVACSIPSGIKVGTLVVDLVDYNKGTGFGKVYGSFSVPLSSMSSNMSVFSGSLLSSPFVNSVSPSLQLRVRIASMGVLADCSIDRIEVYETLTPYLKAQVYGSYVNQPESIDASSTGGILDTTSENSQPCMGGFVMRDVLYILKTGSMYATENSPTSEPGGWGLHEISNKVGAIGINSYDTGEGWAITACRAGIFGFNGGQPVKIMQELWNLWEQINWDAGNTIVLRNDIVNKRLYCAIPLPTGADPVTGIPANKLTYVWLPNAPYNPTPTTPNVMLMLNYQGMATFDEMIGSPEVHTTMFGTLAAVDMKRKWSIWNIATPYMDFITAQDAESHPLYICNGIGSSKIYQLLQDQTSDDGAAINSLYTTYGFVNAAKAATLPIFGFHAKRYTVLQTAITGGQADSSTTKRASIRILPNTLTARYPYTVPIGIPLSDPVQDDFFRPINVKGNRVFVEVSTNSVGSWFNLSKLLLTGKADPWSTLNPTGGGNLGINA